jgi:hypothetical protein
MQKKVSSSPVKDTCGLFYGIPCILHHKSFSKNLPPEEPDD